MAIIIKNINNKQYAYKSYRKGKKVIHKYIGSLSDKKVLAFIEAQKIRKTIPAEFYPFFGDTDPKQIILKNHSTYIIEKCLETGSLNMIEWLQKIYPTYKIIDCYERSRRISQKSKNFWKIWFGGNQ